MDGMSVTFSHSFVQVVMGSSSFWMFVFVVVYDLYTAYYGLHFIICVNLVFSHDLS